MTGHASDYLHDDITWTGFLGYLAAFLVTFTVVDLFQVKESAETGSFDKFNRYFANSYPHCIPRRIADIPGCIFSWKASREAEPVPSSKVSVVLWTDDMLVASAKELAASNGRARKGSGNHSTLAAEGCTGRSLLSRRSRKLAGTVHSRIWST